MNLQNSAHITISSLDFYKKLLVVLIPEEMSEYILMDCCAYNQMKQNMEKSFEVWWHFIDHKDDVN